MLKTSKRGYKLNYRRRLRTKSVFEAIFHDTDEVMTDVTFEGWFELMKKNRQRRAKFNTEKRTLLYALRYHVTNEEVFF